MMAKLQSQTPVPGLPHSATRNPSRLGSECSVGGFMTLPAPFRRQICARLGLSVFLAIIVMATLLFNSGCGGNSPGAPVLKGHTLVTVAFTGTANDQLIQFDLAIQSITLTNKLGKTVTLVSGLQPTEWMHVNGGAEPLVTVSIPQDIYTAATATIGEADFSCSQLTPL